MEQNSQDETIIILESQIRECYGRVAYTHKTHEKCADIIKKRNDRLKIWQIALSALITSSFLAKVFGSTKICDIDVALVGGAIISVVLLALNTYLKDYDLGALMQKHANCATELWSIRETYLSLLTDMKAGLIQTEQIVEQRNELQEKLTGIYMGSPRTINKAYAKAQKALKVNEELTFSDLEIDVMLPKELRREKI
ncbi:SLATT domain-containing protein [Ignavibacteriales bacterium]